MELAITLAAGGTVAMLTWLAVSNYRPGGLRTDTIYPLLSAYFGNLFGPFFAHRLPDFSARYDLQIQLANAPGLPASGAAFLGASLGFALMMFAFIVPFLILAGTDFFLSLFLSLFFAAIGFLMHIRIIARLLEARTKALDKEFPYFLDFIVMTKQAGAILIDSIRLFVEATGGSRLAREMDDLITNQAMGPQGLLGALSNYRETCPSEVGKTALMAIISAEPVGAESSTSLTSLAGDMRHERRQRAEREAESIRSKIMMPVTVMLMGAMIMILSGFLPQILFGF